MSGFDNDILYADNVDFTGGSPVTAQMVANGQLLIGSAVAPFIRANTLTAGTGISITNGAGTITITNTGGGGGGGGTESLAGNSGSATEAGGVINVLGSGGLTTSGAGQTLTVASTGVLAGLNSLAGTGYVVQTGASTFTNRTFLAGSGISLTNADGVSGATTITASAIVPTTFTEDAGSATPAANNLNVLGTSAQGISTSGAGSTVTITAANASAVQKGVATFDSTNFSVAAGNVTSNALTVTAGTGLATGGSVNLGGSVTLALDIPVTVPHGGTGQTTLTNHGVLLGQAASSIVATTAGTNGQVLIGATGADPAFATISGTQGVTLTPGANTLSIGLVNVPNSALQNSSITVTAGSGISVVGSPVSLGGAVTISATGTIVTQFSADAGVAVPSGNNINLLGTASQGISTSASGATVTFTVANATTTTKGVASFNTNDFTVSSGAVSLKSTGAGKTITGDTGGALSPTANNWNIVGGTNMQTSGSGSTLTLNVQAPFAATSLTSNSLLLGNGSSNISALGAATNGQLPIGSTGNAPVLATITAGSGISVTNGAGSITIAATGSSPPSSFVSSQLDFVEDFVSGFDLTKATTGNIGNWYFSNSGAVLSMNLESTVGRPGVWTLTTAGSPLSCYLSLTQNNTSYGTIVVTGGVITCVWSAKLEILSSVSGRFTAQLGMLIPSLATTQTDGFYFSYTDTVNSGKWVIVNAYNSSRTTTNTTVTADTNYHTFKVVINSNATSVEYFIDGVSVGTITTNICLNLVSPAVVLIQTSGSGASGAIDLDYVTLNQVFTSTR